MVKNIFATYEKYNKAQKYILGFVFQNVIYMTKTTKDIPIECLTCEKASRGQGIGLRLRIKKSLMENLVPSCTPVGTIHDFENTKYNKGEIFEKLVTEHFGQIWTKDNVPFTESGDINVDGVEIQIKFNGATFVTTKTLERIEAEG